MDKKNISDIMYDMIIDIRDKQDDLMTQIVENQSTLRAHLDVDELMHENIHRELQKISHVQEVNTKDIADHMERTRIAEEEIRISKRISEEQIKVLQQMSEKINKLEEPSKFWKTLRKHILSISITIAAVAGAITAVYEFFKK